MGVILTDQGEIEAPARAMVIVAHPDDIDFGMAGTVAALTAAGCHVAYCLATSGEAGGDDLSQTPDELAEVRQAEQTAAAGKVGVSELHWLGHPDGMVVAGLGLRRDIARVIRMSRPDVVLCQTTIPNWDHIYISHPDHLATATAALAAVYPDARNPRAFPELLDEGHKPHSVSEIWLTGTEPNRYIDITDTFECKIAALSEHHSQLAPFDGLADRVWEWCTRTAQAAGLPEGRVAEAYRVVSAG
ncbi:PIG-L deacetylase family protein [Candidatus Poriferisodalis sp.]|uniref:PIG-L deacetylase family protein n=1 Tax=Candidatus Poriferisodalis sp. TaxID=3101277 RepID=UPI003B5AC239